jgi:hypothetical protein
VKKLQNFINGSFVDGASGETSTLINPSTGQAFATAPISNGADVDMAMKAAFTLVGRFTFLLEKKIPASVSFLQDVRMVFCGYLKTS